MTSDAELESLRTELQQLRSQADTNLTMQAQRLRARVAELEREAHRTRAEYLNVLGGDGERGMMLLRYDDAVSRLLEHLIASRAGLTDSNVLLSMQVVRDMRSKLGLP